MRGAATYGFAAIVLSLVLILVIPLPAWLLDILLAINIMGSALVLLISVSISDPLEFSAFAPALLVATLFRLSLDVSATRLILTQGHLPGGAGSMIPAFGEFVVRGNLVVGLIVFAILITIQFIVIAAGSQRVAEVAARFTLDAMPGKQMAIDADLHAGVLNADGARFKRQLVQKEADFYGAMDGAGKFVKGDAVAALIIVALNLVGGLIVGIAYHGLSAGEALNTFALLSIGNALVTTLPAFLISTAMGMMVTRVAAEGSLGFDLATQILSHPEILRCAGVLVLGLALVPALPRPVFLILGSSTFIAAALAQRQKRETTIAQRNASDAARRQAIRRPEMALGLVGVDAISIDVGANLSTLLTLPASEQLLDRIGEVRRALASEIGIVLPGVRLRDDLSREPDTYAVRVRDEVAGEGALRLSALLAVADERVLDQFAGERVREPVYDLPAQWIAPQQREEATTRGALVFDPVSILGSHLAEVARTHAAELLGRQELQTLLEHLRATVPTLLKDVGSEQLPISTLHKAYLMLLRERVWPRDPVATLEAMADAAQTSREARDIAEAARRILVPLQLRRRGTRTLEPFIFAPELESELSASWAPTGSPSPSPPNPAIALALRLRVQRYLQRSDRNAAAVVCTTALRPALADFLRRSGLEIEVYSYAELPPEVELKAADVMNMEPAQLSAV
ncbi:MAG: FHIPEP family type III secretion protein [Candidatus Eremiobacteraeota bacterium]|nr:FHIPEP family type III secretion protein [Candidatus Eremiobacteraeota bacterium]